MREYGQIQSAFWKALDGKVRPVPPSKYRLSFRYPGHMALRAHVFSRDGFKCRRCQVPAGSVPVGYDGRYSLRAGNDLFVVDHVITLAAGGTHHPANLQMLCETCNRRKIPEDRAAIARSGGYGR